MFVGSCDSFILVLLVHDFKIKPSGLITMKLVFQNKESLNFHCVSEGTTYVELVLSLLLEGPRDHFRRPFRLTPLGFLKEEVGYCCQDTVFRTRVTGTDPPVPPRWGLAAASLPWKRRCGGMRSESVRAEPERLVPCQWFV